MSLGRLIAKYFSKNFDAPGWFNLASYAECSKLDVEGWITQIVNRIFLKRCLELGDPVSLDRFDTCFKEIQDHLFYDIGCSAEYAANRAVYPLTVGIAKSIAGESTERDLLAHDACDSRFSELNDCCFDGVKAHLVIDLSVKPTIILKHFENWLEAAQSGQVRTVRKNALPHNVFSSWCDFNILAYYDLMLWYERTGCKIPTVDQLGEILFPGLIPSREKMSGCQTACKTFQIWGGNSVQ